MAGASSAQQCQGQSRFSKLGYQVKWLINSVSYTQLATLENAERISNSGTRKPDKKLSSSARARGPGSGIELYRAPNLSTAPAGTGAPGLRQPSGARPGPRPAGAARSRALAAPRRQAAASRGASAGPPPAAPASLDLTLPVVADTDECTVPHHERQAAHGHAVAHASVEGVTMHVHATLQLHHPTKTAMCARGSVCQGPLQHSAICHSPHCVRVYGAALCSLPILHVANTGCS